MTIKNKPQIKKVKSKKKIKFQVENLLIIKVHKTILKDDIYGYITFSYNEENTSNIFSYFVLFVYSFNAWPTSDSFIILYIFVRKYYHICSHESSPVSWMKTSLFLTILPNICFEKPAPLFLC